MIQVSVCSFVRMSGSASAILLQAKARLGLVLRLQVRFRSISQACSFSHTYQPPCHIHLTANHRGARGKSNCMYTESLCLMSVHITLPNARNPMKSGPVMLACKLCPKVEGGEGNGSPLQCSCLENPRDEGAWWAAVYGVAQSRTWLNWLSSSSSSKVEGDRRMNPCWTRGQLSYSFYVTSRKQPSCRILRWSPVCHMGQSWVRCPAQNNPWERRIKSLW